jgi:hypothetical protein
MESQPPSLHSSLDHTLYPKRKLRHQLACKTSRLLIQPTECHARLDWKVLSLWLPSAKNRRRPLPGRCLAQIQKYLTHFGRQLRIHRPYVTARSRQRVSALSIYCCTRFLNELPTSPCHAMPFDHHSKCVFPEFGKKRPLRDTSVKACFRSAAFVPSFSDHSFRI